MERPLRRFDNDYDLYICQAGLKPTKFNLQNRRCGSGIQKQNGDDNPYERAVAFDSGENRRLELSVSQFTSILEYWVPEGGIVSQPAVEGVLAVGAIDASGPGYDDPEDFSDMGPSRIYDYSDDSFEDRLKPDVMGIDGVLVTGSGGFGESVEGISASRFYGTSAAAPHVAAIAALVMEAQRKATPGATRKEVADAVTQAIRDNAIDLGDDGHDFDTGYGRADALSTIQALAESSSTFSLDSTSTFTQTFTVYSTGDGADSTTTSDCACDDSNGNCTLRAAIQQANAGNRLSSSSTSPAAVLGPYSRRQPCPLSPGRSSSMASASRAPAKATCSSSLTAPAREQGSAASPSAARAASSAAWRSIASTATVRAAGQQRRAGPRRQPHRHRHGGHHRRGQR